MTWLTKVLSFFPNQMPVLTLIVRVLWEAISWVFVLALLIYVMVTMT